jgi:hypothetical protein
LLSQLMVAFTTIAQGTAANIASPQNVVVRTPGEWTRLWEAQSPKTPAPPVDFARVVVVGVFLGSRPTAGYSVEITAVKVADRRAVVEYVEHRPDPGDILAQVITSPFHLVSVPREYDSIEFKKIEP